MPTKKLWTAVLVLLAGGLIAAGCGGDNEATVSVPTSAQEAIDKANEALSTASEQATDALQDASIPENIDEQVQQCIDGVEQSNLDEQTKQTLKDACESGGDAANQALKQLNELQDQLGQ
jgi:division protein CdvB (Snf7/Vps24/ESCRT-III family)